MRVLEQQITNDKLIITTPTIVYSIEDGMLTGVDSSGQSVRVTIHKALNVLNSIGYPLKGIINESGKWLIQ